MRNTIAKTSIAAAIVALGFSAYSSQAIATEPGTTADVLYRACTVAAGRFEQSWSYNDTGVQWGEIASCVTDSVRLTCQGNVCKVNGLDRNSRTAVLVKQKVSPDLGLAVLPVREEFDRVLSNTAMF